MDQIDEFAASLLIVRQAAKFVAVLNQYRGVFLTVNALELLDYKQVWCSLTV